MRHTDKTSRHSPVSRVPGNSDGKLPKQESRNESRVARKDPRTSSAGSQPLADRGQFVDSMAISDAMSDMEVGNCRLFESMEQLFSGGDITRAAWQRYCRTYQAERCVTLPRDTVRASALMMDMDPPV